MPYDPIYFIKTKANAYFVTDLFVSRKTIFIYTPRYKNIVNLEGLSSYYTSFYHKEFDVQRLMHTYKFVFIFRF